MSEEFRKQENEGRRKWLLNVSFSSILALCFLAIVAMAMAYIGGVMSGRHMEEDARSHPRTTPMRERPVSEESAKINEIIAAEDLEFARVLRGEPARKPEKTSKVDDRAEKAEAESATSSPPESLPETAEPTVSKKTIFGMRDYIFQAGAFRDEASADSLRQKLEGYGLRTRMEKKNKFYIVLIMLRGDEERVKEIMDIARALKLGEPILRRASPPAQ